MDNWVAPYVEVLQQLKPHNLETLSPLLSEQVEFKDPFNHTTTRDGFMAILEDMFTKLSGVRFVVHDQMMEGTRGYIFWTYYATNSLTGDIEFEGVSKLQADENGLVTEHYDIWDGSAVMQQLPVIGKPVGLLRKKFSHGA